MSDLDVQPVASSATEPVSALEHAVAARDFAAFKAASRGLPPESPVADSTPAEPAEQVASTDASPLPDSEPGAPAKADKRNAETRVQELLKERSEWRKEQAELRSRLASLDVSRAPSHDVKAASSPAPVGEKFPDFSTWQQRDGNASLEYEDFIDARAAHVYEQRRSAERAEDARQIAERTQRERLVAHHERVSEFAKEHEDYWTVIEPIMRVPDTPGIVAAADVIGGSEHSVALLYYLGAHLEDFHQIAAMSPTAAAAAIGRIEASLSAPSVSPRTTNTVTRAPSPPTSLGQKTTTSAPDDEMAAVKEKDFLAFKAVAQRKRLAERR